MENALSFRGHVEAEKQRLKLSTPKKPDLSAIPTTLAGLLRYAADLAEKNEELERQLHELRTNREYGEVLRPAQLEKLCGVSKSKVTEWTADPTFPVLNKHRKKGEAILVRKESFYRWLETHRFE